MPNTKTKSQRNIEELKKGCTPNGGIVGDEPILFTAPSFASSGAKSLVAPSYTFTLSLSLHPALLLVPSYCVVADQIKLSIAISAPSDPHKF